jgi:hypothetical protein
MDVETLTVLLREAEEHHAGFEATADPHHWWDYYAAYVVAREQGRDPDRAAAAAGEHVRSVS